MDNNTILNDRWKYTDDKLKEYLKTYKKISSRTQDNIQDIFNSIDYEYIDLNKPISKTQREKLERVIEEWEKDGLLSGYFKYKVDLLLKKKNITNQEMLDILLWGTYVKERNQLDEYEQVLFTEIGQDLYNQGINEIKPNKKKKWSLTWEYIWSLLCLPNVKGNSWITYIEALALTNSQEIEKQAMIYLQQNKKPNINDDVFKNIVNKQQNRYICINDDKISGALESEIEEIGNKAIVKAGEDVGDKNLKARFIAVIDGRTTKMCRGMNNMLFNVNDWNKFYRYSDIDDKDVYYTCKGLVQGINLPPITNHFHYCRSTITYQLEESIANEVRESIKVANEYDKEQYSRYKKYFGDEIPDNVEEFTKMKYNNPDEWEYLKQNYNDRKLRYKIRNEYNLNINIQKQNKHIKDTKEYKTYIKTNPNVSILTIENKDIQEIINKYAGYGIKLKSNGAFNNKECINCNKNIGYVKDLNNEIVKTTFATIHYSKTGTHLVPTLRGVKND